MPLLSNTKQNKSNSLESFYEELRENNQVWNRAGEMMLSFIQMINETLKETVVWGLTSHARLVLQNEDNWAAKWYVIVRCIGSSEYYISYLMPEDVSPWPNATVEGVATSLEAAKSYLLVAMKESRGWPESLELKKLLEDISFGSRNPSELPLAGTTIA